MRDGIYRDGAVIPFGDGRLSLRIIYKDKKGSAKAFLRTLPKNMHIQKSATYQPVCKVQCDYILEVYTQSRDAGEISACIEKFFREYARKTLTLKAEAYASKMDVEFNRIAIKAQRTRWGSCSTKGNLNFNWKIILMPEFVQNYIVVHELAHLKQMNHSKAFWAEVERMIPFYKECVRWLRANERKLIGW